MLGQAGLFLPAFLGALARSVRENRSAIATSYFFQQPLSAYLKTNYKVEDLTSWDVTTLPSTNRYSTQLTLMNVFTDLIGILSTLYNKLKFRSLRSLISNN